MIKNCIVCGKEFECYDKKHHARIRTRTSKRAFNWKTCSHKCSVINQYKRIGVNRCEEVGCKNKGIGFINNKFLCKEHYFKEKYGETNIPWLSKKSRKILNIKEVKNGKKKRK